MLNQCDVRSCPVTATPVLATRANHLRGFGSPHASSPPDWLKQDLEGWLPGTGIFQSPQGDSTVHGGGEIQISVCLVLVGVSYTACTGSTGLQEGAPWETGVPWAGRGVTESRILFLRGMNRAGVQGGSFNTLEWEGSTRPPPSPEQLDSWDKIRLSS